MPPSDSLGVRPFLYTSLPLSPASAGADVDATIAGESGEAAPAAAGDSAGEVLVVLSMGSVANFSGDAIVNAANTGCLYGGGVDMAINRGGGIELEEAREALPVLDDLGTRCQVGDAKRTIGGNLAAKWVIHAVGPHYGVICTRPGAGFDEGDKLLHSAYVSAMKRAEEVGVEKLGFCLISAGIFRGRRTLEEVLSIAVAAVEEGVYAGLKEVHLVAFTREEVRALEDAATRRWEDKGWQAVRCESAAPKPEQPRMQKGDYVTAQGLEGAAYLNGMEGEILGFNQQNGRYMVRFENEEKKQLKPENLLME